ncbi:MAG: hypothetical protein ACYC6V_04430 [Bacillota bacterium]
MKPDRVDWYRPWFNGSDKAFEVLRPGSTITQWRELAEAFSHQPGRLWYDDDGQIGHDGRRDGYLYMVDEPVRPEAVEQVPGSTMDPGLEWHTKRPLRVRLVTRLPAKGGMK